MSSRPYMSPRTRKVTATTARPRPRANSIRRGSTTRTAPPWPSMRRRWITQCWIGKVRTDEPKNQIVHSWATPEKSLVPNWRVPMAMNR